MATDVERLVLELSADVAKLDRGMRQGQRIAEQRTAAIARSYDQLNKRTVGSVTAMSAGINSAIGGIALGLAAREVQQYADAWTRATNSLKASGLSVEDTNKRMADLVAISVRSRSALEGTVTLYNRLTAASGELGVSQQQVARVVETVNKALATSNMTQGERASAVTQLAQGLGSGNLAGDELKAIRENSQVLAQAIATEFGVTIGELKKLGEEGELTSVRVFAAIEKASGKVDTAFGRTRATIDDALTNLQTKTIAFIGTLDASTGASAKFAAVVEFVADHLDEIAAAAGTAAVVIGTGYATALTVAAVRTAAATVSSIAYQVALMRMAAATAGTTTAQIALNAALTANPIGLVIVAVAALAGGLYLLSQRQTEAARTMEELAAQTTASDRALQNYETAQIAAKNASGESAVAARNNADAMREEAEAAIVAARALAAKSEAAAQSRMIAAQAALIEATSQRPREEGEAIGQLAVAASAQRAYEAASDSAAAALAERIRQEKELARITAGVNLGGGGPRPSSSDGKGAARRASGPTPEELAAMRVQIGLERELAIARAQGNEVEEKRLQRLLDIASLTEQMTRAGIADAATQATQQVDAIRDAEAFAQRYEDFLKESERGTEERAEAEAALAAEMDRQLETQLALARIEGNEAVIVMLERELQLRQALAALGPGATAEQRAAVRGDEAMLNRAEDRARLAEDGREMARNFLDIVSAEDPWTEAGNRFRAAAFDNLEEVLGNIFAQLMNGNAQGGGVGGAVANVVGSLFGGRRALGGPVKAGQFYKVNENTPNSEYFSPKQDGWVGNMKPQRAQASRGPVQMTFRTEYNLQGAAGTEAILGTVQRMQAASERRILTTVQAAAPNAQLEQQLLKG
jgi:tape measure domain-containing protein